MWNSWEKRVTPLFSPYSLKLHADDQKFTKNTFHKEILTRNNFLQNNLTVEKEKKQYAKFKHLPHWNLTYCHYLSERLSVPFELTPVKRWFDLVCVHLYGYVFVHICEKSK